MFDFILINVYMYLYYVLLANGNTSRNWQNKFLTYDKKSKCIYNSLDIYSNAISYSLALIFNTLVNTQYNVII